LTEKSHAVLGNPSSVPDKKSLSLAVLLSVSSNIQQKDFKSTKYHSTMFQDHFDLLFLLFVAGSELDHDCG